MEVHLDKGCPDGHRYTFKGESDEVPDVDPGDVIVEITVEKHKKFTRKGANLVYTTDITLIEALGGFEMTIDHLDKRNILIKTKPGEIIKPAEIKTVRIDNFRENFRPDFDIYLQSVTFVHTPH